MSGYGRVGGVRLQKVNQPQWLQGYRDLLLTKRKGDYKYNQEHAEKTLTMIKQYRMQSKVRPYVHIKVAVSNVGEHGYLKLRVRGMDYHLTSDILYEVNGDTYHYISKSGDTQGKIVTVVRNLPGLSLSEKVEIINLLRLRKKIKVGR